MKQKGRINILGAYDRHNYGDLLFPVILKNFLTAEFGNKYDIEIFAIRNSDLAIYGALKTKGIKDLYVSLNDKSYNNVLIIAGGDVMTAQWASILLSLKHPARLLMRGASITNKLFNRNKLAKFILGGQSDFPFVIDKSNFSGLKKIIYNSIGGTNFHKFQHHYGDALKTDYLSVRDKVFYDRIKMHNQDVKLIPDSAIIMSKIFPVNDLKALISKEVLNFAIDNEFVFFQINKKLAENSSPYISESLKHISKKYNLKICLCPIGRANQHEDHIPLKEIHNQLKDESFYIDQPNIWEVMYLIANSKIYIGTSLHGAITAMSYNIPYMGIKVTKLNDYLRTWSFAPLNKIFSTSEIVDNFEQVVNVDNHKLIDSRNAQMKLVELSFNDIKNVISSLNV